jgi:RND family efflux transporter MFP subunit
MDDKSALLNQLRIDRSEQQQPSGGKRWLLVVVVLCVLVIVVVAWFWMRPAPVAVHVAVAQPMAPGGTGGASGAASILDASGYVVARRQAAVASKITGKMVELDIEEGDRIKEGQVIARLDDTNIRASLNSIRAQQDYAKAGLAETQVNLANAERDYARQKSLLNGKFVSQAIVDNSQTTVEALRAQLATQRVNVEVAERNVQLAERNLDDTIVRAPFAGVVIAKSAQVGEIVSPLSAGGGFTRTGIGTIVDMDSLEVEVDVNEAYIGRVQPGQSVVSVLNAYPDWKIPSHVIAIIPTADRAKATVKVRVGLDLKDARIVPDMGVRVSFLEDSKASAESQPRPRGVLIPNQALRDEGGQEVVFVFDTGKAKRRTVTLGGSVGDSRQVQSGLSAGESVILDAPAGLKDDAAVTLAKP